MTDILLQDVHDDGKVRLEFRLLNHPAGKRSIVKAAGKGTMGGADAMVAFLDKSIALTGNDTSSALMLLDGMESTPIRAQFLLGKWLLKHKGRVGHVSVVGAKAWERKVAQAVCAIAGFKNLAFHLTEAEGRAWLGWTD